MANPSHTKTDATRPFRLSARDMAMTAKQYDGLIRRLREGGN